MSINFTEMNSIDDVKSRPINNAHTTANGSNRINLSAVIDVDQEEQNHWKYWKQEAKEWLHVLRHDKSLQDRIPESRSKPETFPSNRSALLQSIHTREDLPNPNKSLQPNDTLTGHQVPNRSITSISKSNTQTSYRRLQNVTPYLKRKARKLINRIKPIRWNQSK